MKVALWILQALLAILAIAGGAYKLFNAADVLSTIPDLPLAGWMAFGAIEVASGLLLMLPPLLKRGQARTPVAAAVLAVESLVLATLYARQSLAFEAENPLVWAVAMACLSALLVLVRRAPRGELRSRVA
ncbi:MAG: hypothetical protein LCH84_03155 [Gemmatimonadetes bacterium]|nr:hypothetical protein [Gemmatimonadota bacterium]